MKNNPERGQRGSAIRVNGPALRQIRRLLGLSIVKLAQEIGGITPDYIRKVERGHCKTVSPPMFRAICHRLRIDDRRVLLADPYDNEAEIVAQLNEALQDESEQDEAASAG